MSVNIDPKQWGPKLWKSLHYIAYAFPEQPTEAQQQAAQSLFQALAHLLPCAKCRTHYANHLAETPPQVESRQALARYVNELHNKVNEHLGKQEVAHDPKRPYSKAGASWVPILIAVVVGILIGVFVSSWR